MAITYRTVEVRANALKLRSNSHEARVLRELGCDPLHIAELIDALADRLEQDAQTKTLDVEFVSGRTIEQRDEELREEGRREILAEIAKIEEPVRRYDDGDSGPCLFCDEYSEHHKPDCLWLRSQQIASQETQEGRA